VKTASADQQALARGFHDALAEYRKELGRGPEAFQAVLAKFPRTVRRSSTWNGARLFRRTPPADWDGVYTMTTK
jgi:hypothetical protein